MQSMSRYLLVSLMCLGCIGAVFLFTHKTPSFHLNSMEKSAHQSSFVSSGTSSSLDSSKTVEPEVLLPEVPVTDLAGKQVSLASYGGRPALVVFWTTWCQPCKKEMAFLQEKAASLKATNHINVIGVNMFSSEFSKTEVRRFVKDRNIRFPVLLDGTDQLTAALNVHTIPSSFLFNKKGELIASTEGPLENQTLDQLIGKLKSS